MTYVVRLALALSRVVGADMECIRVGAVGGVASRADAGAFSGVHPGDLEEVYQQILRGDLGDRSD